MSYPNPMLGDFQSAGKGTALTSSRSGEPTKVFSSTGAPVPLRATRTLRRRAPAHRSKSLARATSGIRAPARLPATRRPSGQRAWQTRRAEVAAGMAPGQGLAAWFQSSRPRQQARFEAAILAAMVATFWALRTSTYDHVCSKPYWYASDLPHPSFAQSVACAAGVQRLQKTKDARCRVT